MAFKDDPSPREYLFLKKNPKPKVLFMEFDNNDFPQRNPFSTRVLKFVTLNSRATYKNSFLLLSFYVPCDILNYNFNNSFPFTLFFPTGTV